MLSIAILLIYINIIKSEAYSIKNTYDYSNKYSDYFLSDTKNNLESNKYLTHYIDSHNNIHINSLNNIHSNSLSNSLNNIHSNSLNNIHSNSFNNYITIHVDSYNIHSKYYSLKLTHELSTLPAVLVAFTQ